MKRKGISPIIASVLLLAVTITVVSVFMGWAPNIADTVTDSAENQTLHRINCDKASININSAFYNSSSTNLTVSVRNNGRIALEKVSLAAFDANDRVLEQKTGLNLSSSELNDTVIDMSEEPSYVEAYTDKCGSISDKFEDITQ